MSNLRYSRQNTKFTHQERLAKEDIKLLVTILEDTIPERVGASDDRLNMLLGKLKRMEKQK